MYKFLLFISLTVSLFSRGWAQNGDSTATDTSTTTSSFINPELRPKPGPLLDNYQLQSAKWFESFDEAMREPEKVYKLSLEGKKYKNLTPDIARFVNLQMLNLGSNKLKTLPPEIGDLSNLQVLILTNNKIRRLPEELKELGNLTTLYLGRNKLVEMPAWVGGFGKLRKLDLSLNLLTDYEIGLVKYRLPRCVVTN